MCCCCRITSCKTSAELSTLPVHFLLCERLMLSLFSQEWRLKKRHFFWQHFDSLGLNWSNAHSEGVTAVIFKCCFYQHINLNVPLSASCHACLLFEWHAVRNRDQNAGLQPVQLSAPTNLLLQPHSLTQKHTQRSVFYFNLVIWIQWRNERRFSLILSFHMSAPV